MKFSKHHDKKNSKMTREQIRKLYRTILTVARVVLRRGIMIKLSKHCEEDSNITQYTEEDTVLRCPHSNSNMTDYVIKGHESEIVESSVSGRK